MNSAVIEFVKTVVLVLRNERCHPPIDTTEKRKVPPTYRHNGV